MGKASCEKASAPRHSGFRGRSQSKAKFQGELYRSSAERENQVAQGTSPMQ